MAFTTANLSLYHSFSKMPAQNSTTLGNAINKSGHTVTASEVWAQDIPYYGKMGSLDDVKSKVQPYARKNDMCYITAGDDKGKTFQYDGNGNWTDITATLVDGALIKNAKDEVVLLYHKGQTLTNLTAENNANTDSANNAARLWAKRDTDGVTIADNGTRLIEQFVAPTDKALNGLASVAYAPVIANGSLISGTNYYDYCFSGTILWATARTAATLIDCFEYVGEKVSDVVDTVSTQGTAIQSVKNQVDTISDALGLGSEVVGTTLGSRVTDNETALKVLLGLADGDKVVATESIATTAANAVSTSLTGTTDGTIGKAIAAAKQEALDAINAIQHFSVVVVPEGQTMENVTPVENTIYLVSDAQAADGSYIEYIAFKQGETVVTERIGTTKLDLEGYTTDAEHEALQGRVSANEEQIATITSTDATKEGSIAKALADAKTYAEQQAAAAQSGAESTAATKLAEAVEQIGKDIEAAKQAAIASAEVTITAGTGIVVEGEGKGTTFEISVSDEVATAASVSALSQVVASNKSELEGKITSAQTTLQGSIDGVAGRVTTLETVTVPALDSRLTDAEEAITSLTSGEDSVDSKIAAAKKDLQDEIDDINTSLTTGAIHTEIDGVRQTANAAKGKADTAVQTVKVNGTALTATDNAVDITAIVGVAAHPASDEHGVEIVETADHKVQISVTAAEYSSSTKTWQWDNYLTTASDVAAAISDAVGAIVIPVFDASIGAKNVGFDVGTHENSGNHYLDLATAAYTPAVGETAASWANKGYLVTGSTVETFVGAETAKALAEAKAYSESLHTTSVDYVVADTLPTVESGKEKEFKGKIYLVLTGIDGVVAADGARIEYMYVQENGVWGWEQIGTTTADLSGCAKSVTINGTKYEATAENSGALNLGAVASSVAAGTVTGTISTTGELELTIDDATTSQKGAVQLTEAYDKEDDAQAATGKSIAAAIETLADSKSVNGITVTQSNGVISSVTEELITASVPEGTTSVEGNVAYVGTEKHVIAPEKFQTAAQMPATLTSWVADLSNLTNGDNMFKGCTSLTVFVGDLSSLTSGVDMFNGCTLDAESLEILSENLPTVSGGTIDIGASTNATEEVIAEIKGKGWTLMSNGVAL